MRRADAIDPRTICWGFAAIGWILGFVILAWGPIWFGTDLAGQPWAKAGLIRAVGALLMADGCFAAALASISDLLSLRRAVKWFLMAHAVVLLVLKLQQVAIWGESDVQYLLSMMLVLATVFGYLWLTAHGEQPGHFHLTTLFTTSETEEAQLTSEYEAQIRKAASQEERNRLARDLHDSIKQQIFAIQTSAATAQTRFEADPTGAKEALNRVRDSAREAMGEMEAMLDQLRATPLENVGLTEALKKHCEALEFRTGARVRLQVDKLPSASLIPPGAQESIFRAAQEALANVARHARAQNVTVRLSVPDGQIALTVEDDGAGFDPNEHPAGMGLANMRTRAEEFRGEFVLDSRPGGGTKVTFRIPLLSVQPGSYLRRALLSTLLFVGISADVIFVKKQMNMFAVPVAIIAVIEAIRTSLAYRRTRSLA
jgi:signal transduction histidine kinase